MRHRLVIACAGAWAIAVSLQPPVANAAGCGPGHDREPCLQAIKPPARQWKRVVEIKPPVGYVCVLFGTQGNPTCSRDEVRAVSGWRRKDRCGSSMTLYWASGRGPHRVDVDETGMMILPSDGRVFLYLEADDYVVEAETAPSCKQKVRNDLRNWTAQIRTALKRGI